MTRIRIIFRIIDAIKVGVSWQDLSRPYRPYKSPISTLSTHNPSIILGTYLLERLILTLGKEVTTDAFNDLFSVVAALAADPSKTALSNWFKASAVTSLAPAFTT